MNQQNLINKIIQLFTYFVTEVKLANSLPMYDINSISENILIPIFKEVFGYSNLKNLNFSERINHPAVDLGDEIARVAFQVTSTADSSKLKETLERFITHELYKKYDQRLFVYILTEKQKSYSQRLFDSIIQGKFQFNVERDILDCKDLIREISSLTLEKIQTVCSFLENQFGIMPNNDKGKIEFFRLLNDNFTQLKNICEQLVALKIAIKNLSPEQANYFVFLEKHKKQIDSLMPELPKLKDKLLNLEGEAEVLYGNQDIAQRVRKMRNIIESAFYRQPSQPMDNTDDVIAVLPEIDRLFVEIKTTIGDELKFNSTRREPIVKHIHESQEREIIVERCLADNPNERFQSISEVKSFVQQQFPNLENKVNPFDLLHLFHDAISATFPKKRRGAISTNDTDLIDRLFKNIMERDFQKKLWWMRALGDNTVQFRKLNSNNYLMNEFEISVKEIWAYSDEGVYADAILLILNSMPSFGIYDDTTDLDIDTVGLVDGKTYITGEEYDHGYAELDGQIINLAVHDVELRSRFLKPTTVFIIPIHSPFIQRESERIARQFLKRFENDEKPNLEEFEKFIMETRSNMPHYIREML